MSVISGTPLPLPFPSIFEPTQGQIGLLNGINLSITIIGSLIGVAFFLERRQNLKFEKQEKKIDSLEDKLDEAVLATGEQFKMTRQELREMELRLCQTHSASNNRLEKTIEDKVLAAKSLEDERITNINQRISRLEGFHYKRNGDNINSNG